MKPSILQRAVAGDWIAKSWIGGVVGGVVLGLVLSSLPLYAVLGFSFSSAGLTLAIVAFGFIAYFGSLILGSCLLPPLYRHVEKRNGAPFQKGDRVEILRKPNLGKTGVITQVGDPTFGTFLKLEDEPEEAEAINLPWYSVRILARAKEKDAG